MKPPRLDSWLDFQKHWIFNTPPTSDEDCRNKDYPLVFKVMVTLISKYDRVFDKQL